MTWTEILISFLSSMLGSFVGSSIVAVFLYKAIIKNAGINIGQQFSKGVDDYYAEREEKIKRKTF